MASDYFTGPAVVVDDKIDNPESDMARVLDQIEERSMPIVRMKALPSDDEIDNWRGFALIVLDWELQPVAEEILGMASPSGLVDDNAARLSEFVDKLLERLYCPIFVISNQSLDAIKEELASRLTTVRDQVDARVKVMSKTEVEDHLFDELSKWIESHPAVYAMERWERSYQDARTAMFRNFELTSGDWPRILWATSKDDAVNASFELTEIITRNILNRFNPLEFEDAVLTMTEEEAGVGDDVLSTLRKVVHRAAVVPKEALHDDVIMPGDFFRTGAPEAPEAKIAVNVTPACDLVARQGKSPDDIRMVLLPGDLVSDNTLADAEKMKDLESRRESELVWVMRDDARPYRIWFRTWDTGTWGDLKGARMGRLLDPWLTQLLQRFTLHFQRQGTPHLSDDFYKGNRLGP